MVSGLFTSSATVATPPLCYASSPGQIRGRVRDVLAPAGEYSGHGRALHMHSI